MIASVVQVQWVARMKNEGLETLLSLLLGPLIHTPYKQQIDEQQKNQRGQVGLNSDFASVFPRTEAKEVGDEIEGRFCWLLKSNCKSIVSQFAHFFSSETSPFFVSRRPEEMQ